MAQFCTQCGTALTEGMKFCGGCGAMIGGPPPAPGPEMPVAEAVPVVASGAAPASPAAAMPAPASGSPIVKIVLIIVAVLIFLGLLSAGSCVYLVYRTKQRVSQFRKQVHATFPMPAGTPEVHPQPVTPPSAEAPAEDAGSGVATGVPVYPGATATEGGGELSTGDTSGGTKVQQYTTSDSVDAVAAFYKDKLGPRALSARSGGSALVQLMGSDGAITVAIAPDSGSGKTVFTITSIAK